MRRTVGFFCLAAFAVVALALGAAAQPAPKGDKDGGKDGPPKGPKGPPKFELGRVLPPFVRGELDLTEEQEQKIRALEKSVKQQLEQILSREQLKKLSELPGKGPKGPPEGGPKDKGKKGPPEGAPEDAPKDKGKKGPLDIERAAVKGGIQWFATWESGVREARRSGRPILLVSAAPHCAGVSGVW